MQLQKLTTLPLAILLIVTMFSSLSFAQSSYKGFPYGNCTYYVAKRFDQVAPAPKVNWRGNANAWFDNARRAGWRVSSLSRDARANSIIVWNDGGYGHVGWVERVANGQILIAEMNWTGFGKTSTTWLPLSNLNRGRNGKYRFVGFVFPTFFIGPIRP